MTLDAHLFPCRSDNYGLLARDRATGVVAAIDTPDAARILEELQALGWGRLDLILNTPWHPDHTEGATGDSVWGEDERDAVHLGRRILGADKELHAVPL